MYSCLKDSRIPIPEHFKLLQELCNGKGTCKVQACDSFWRVSLDCPDTSMPWLHYRCNGEVRKVKRKYDKVRKISVCDNGTTPGDKTPTATKTIGETTTTEDDKTPTATKIIGETTTTETRLVSIKSQPK